MRSAEHNECGGTFYTKGGTVCTGAKCPRGHCALGQDIQGAFCMGDILPSDTRIHVCVDVACLDDIPIGRNTTYKKPSMNETTTGLQRS